MNMEQEHLTSHTLAISSKAYKRGGLVNERGGRRRAAAYARESGLDNLSVTGKPVNTFPTKAKFHVILEQAAPSGCLDEDSPEESQGQELVGVMTLFVSWSKMSLRAMGRCFWLSYAKSLSFYEFIIDLSEVNT